MLPGRILFYLVLDMLNVEVSTGMEEVFWLLGRILPCLVLGMVDARISIRMERDFRLLGRILSYPVGNMLAARRTSTKIVVDLRLLGMISTKLVLSMCRWFT